MNNLSVRFLFGCVTKTLLRPAIGPLVALSLVSTAAIAELPVVSDARIVQPPPGAPVAGGYLTINNPSEQALVLTSVSSEDVGAVELHLSEVIDDVATMTEQDEIVIPAGASLEFKHGSYHLMFMNLQSTLAPGDEIAVTIESSAGPIAVTLPVVPPGERHGASHGKGKPMKADDIDHDNTKHGAEHGTDKHSH